MRITEKIYQALTRKISSSLPAKAGAPGANRDEGKPAFSARTVGVRRYWFHAASAGELESLWTLVDRAAASGAEICLSVFSSSGLGPVERLARELRQSGGKLLFAGFSPREGYWRERLAVVQPDVFVTAKYEAWPELWMGLAQFQIPLLLVGARSRPSVRLAKRVCLLLAGRLPPMVLLTAAEADRADLSRLFPKAKVEQAGDPRWDRVARRAQAGSARAREVVEKAKWFPRPWGILGSAWLQDLEFFGARMVEIPGTVWVVPHHVDEVTVGLVERHLQRFAQPIVRSSQGWQEVANGLVRPRFVVVDEAGFLSELYAHGDWAFVGGGFGSGVHSTIEPAIQGIPVAAGAKGSERFPEIGMLQAQGQLKILRNDGDLVQWIAQMKGSSWSGRDAAWLENIRGNLGATDRVWDVILRTADGTLQMN